MPTANPLGGREDLPIHQPEPLREEYKETPLERAVTAIQEGGLRVWFESDYRLARRVAALCPECRVYSCHGHLRLLEEDAG